MNLRPFPHVLLFYFICGCAHVVDSSYGSGNSTMQYLHQFDTCRDILRSSKERSEDIRDKIVFSEKTTLEDVAINWGCGKPAQIGWPIMEFNYNNEYIYWVNFRDSGGSFILQKVVKFKYTGEQEQERLNGELIYRNKDIGYPGVMHKNLEISKEELIEKWGIPEQLSLGYSSPRWLYHRSDGTEIWVRDFGDHVLIPVSD